jgi:hypothetical protein
VGVNANTISWACSSNFVSVLRSERIEHSATDGDSRKSGRFSAQRRGRTSWTKYPHRRTCPGAVSSTLFQAEGDKTGIPATKGTPVTLPRNTSRCGGVCTHPLWEVMQDLSTIREEAGDRLSITYLIYGELSTAAFNLLKETCLRRVCSPVTSCIRDQYVIVFLTKGRVPNRGPARPIPRMHRGRDSTLSRFVSI